MILRLTAPSDRMRLARGRYPRHNGAGHLAPGDQGSGPVNDGRTETAYPRGAVPRTTGTRHDGHMFDLFNGLPVHPLVVHAAVVLIPLTLLGTILISVKRSWRKSLGWWVVLLAFVSVGASVAAKESGERLAVRVGLPVEHAELGDTLPIFAGFMFLAVTALVVADRLTTRRSAAKAAAAPAAETAGSTDDPGAKRSGLVTVLAILAVIVGLIATFQTYRVGDSGAKAVWSKVILNTSGAVSGTGTDDEASPSATPSTSDNSASPASSGSATGSATASPSGTTGTYTLAQVKTHGSASDCWTAINGKVYNLTRWEDQHPGGAANIISLCGTDGTAAFKGQHSNKPRPNDELANFQIGVLSS